MGLIPGKKDILAPTFLAPPIVVRGVGCEVMIRGHAVELSHSGDESWALSCSS
jgi:hypothetical protein